MNTDHCRTATQGDGLKLDMWSDPTTLRVKLYGSLENLRRTVFVWATGISTLRTTK